MSVIYVSESFLGYFVKLDISIKLANGVVFGSKDFLNSHNRHILDFNFQGIHCMPRHLEI